MTYRAEIEERHPTPEGRVRHFLDEYAKLRGIDPEEIHGMHIGDEDRQAVLNVSDLRALLERVS